MPLTSAPQERTYGPEVQDMNAYGNGGDGWDLMLEQTLYLHE